MPPNKPTFLTKFALPTATRKGDKEEAKELIKIHIWARGSWRISLARSTNRESKGRYNEKNKGGYNRESKMLPTQPGQQMQGWKYASEKILYFDDIITDIWIDHLMIWGGPGPGWGRQRRRPVYVPDASPKKAKSMSGACVGCIENSGFSAKFSGFLKTQLTILRNF